MKKTIFSIQQHKQKGNKIHWDLRILNPGNDIWAWSWALPKMRFPNVGERLLAVRVADHRRSYMHFQGRLDNGDVVTLHDSGDATIYKYEKNTIYVSFEGKVEKGFYILIRTNGDNWIIIGSENTNLMM